MTTVTPDRSESQHYNHLLDVIESDTALQALGRESILSELMEVICDHGLEGTIGLRLLHRHNDITEGQHMVEDYFETEDGQAFITRPLLSSAMDSSVVVNSWRYDDGKFVPVEYSRAGLLRSGRVTPQTHEKVFAALGDRIAELGVSELVGPCVLYGRLVDDISPSPEALLLEVTDFEESMNVLTYALPGDPKRQKSRETKWIAERRPSGDGFGSLVVAAKCKCACSVPPEGGHQGTHIHLKQ